DVLSCDVRMELPGIDRECRCPRPGDQREHLARQAAGGRKQRRDENEDTDGNVERCQHEVVSAKPDWPGLSPKPRKAKRGRDVHGVSPTICPAPVAAMRPTSSANAPYSETVTPSAASPEPSRAVW